MLVPFLIMLREGLEAALIVGIVANYLHHTGRRALLPAVLLGILLAVALSLLAGAGLQWAAAEFPQKQQELFEGCVGLIAVGVLTGMVFWMRNAAAAVKRGLESSVEHAVARGMGGWALVGMVFLAVAREGLESVFFLLAVFQQSQDWQAPVGALAGILVSVVLGWGIYAGGLRLNLRRFFRYTGLFVLVVAAGLLAGSLRKFHEAGVWNIGQQVLFDIGEWLPMDSPLGTILAGVLGYQSAPVLSEVLVYVVYLVVALWLFLRPVARPAAAPVAAPGDAMQPAVNASVPVAGNLPAWRPWIILGALLVLASGAAFYAATLAVRARPAAPQGTQVTITIAGRECTPNTVEVPAGLTTFTIINQTARALEWEILDGVMVVDERENIAPGFTQTLRTRLKPGSYQMTCGLLSNPRGTLVVVPSEASRAAAARPELVQYVGMLAEYQVLQRLSLRQAQRELAAAGEALAGGDAAMALQHAATARAAYARLRPLAAQFAGIDAVLEPGLDADTGFAGLMSRLRDEAASSGAAALLPPLEQALAALQSQAAGLEATPARLVRRTAADLRAWADMAENASAWVPLQGAYAGGQRVATLLLPLLADADPEQGMALKRAFEEAGEALCDAGQCRGISLDAPDTLALSRAGGFMRAAAEQLTRAATSLGLEEEQ
ncbi:iron uptake transporter permease EfeU [Kerstersia gyiorum]|uniref:iron uptake transporter permease EfeU n=1 Tax=Kerstersia gyiorum TaxID=206506 RepID=UPI0020A0EF9B|nr:iron uptake transporter permease EfeU [Kerstersia gyiorum]MCP1633978.1 high-affinity iron transporter [Kerstersia gyiorum]MCP1637362.1 high-affinity iron transporter [Kerstersia gyiorum]MCP1671845.1 high-affinity iron transporter [Kerstersia gyiorum]MCP1679822.1 high-affinity iron transporter [Kerstersia gyiorum]MCP1683256.1 high-affinity iron transporter [Kerstersia gyiorum]